MAKTIDPGAVLKLRADTIGEIETLLIALWEMLALTLNPWPPKDAPDAMKTYASIIGPALRDIAGNMAVLFTDSFPSTHSLFYTLLTTVLGEFGATAAKDYDLLLRAIFDDYQADLVSHKSVNPADANKIIASALERASALGLGSRVVTLLFELFVPKSLNFMNWLGPVLAQLSGYDEVVELSRGPQLKAALGNLAEYNANQEFRTHAPSHRDAEQMFARRLITPEQLKRLIEWSGLMAEFEQPMLDDAYGAVSPRILARAMGTGAVDAADLKDVLEFGGLRDKDIVRLEKIFAAMTLQPYEQTAMQAAKRAFERGVRSEAEFDSDLDYLNIPHEARDIIKFNAAIWKEEQLAELYRKSIDADYKWGTLTDAQYIPALEAIGIAEADANAHYAIAAAERHGHEAARVRREAAAFANRVERATVRTVLAEFAAGQIDVAALTLALIAAGVPAAVAAMSVALAETQKAAKKRSVFGAFVTPAQAVLLRERVEALRQQRIKHLVTDAQASAELAGWNIPETSIDSLLARWAALADKEKLPLA